MGTGRIVVWDQFGVTNSFTLESSFFGYVDPINGIIDYLKKDYE
jgi:hypothetical protein